jgi:hypothetical protein
MPTTGLKRQTPMSQNKPCRRRRSGVVAGRRKRCRRRGHGADSGPAIRVLGTDLGSASGRCGNCGRTVDKHGIALVLDHRIPRAWGGLAESDNLWSICEECNAGKKDFFESIDAVWMPQVMPHTSVHMRLGELLKAFKGNPVPAKTMELVANQDDWKKRARELRYIGWEIDVFNRKLPSGRVSSFYRLIKSAPWPDDPTGVIREYERERAKRNKNS